MPSSPARARRGAAQSPAWPATELSAAREGDPAQEGASKGDPRVAMPEGEVLEADVDGPSGCHLPSVTTATGWFAFCHRSQPPHLRSATNGGKLFKKYRKI